MKEFYTKIIETFNLEEIKDKYRLKGIENPKFIDLYAGQDLEPESFEIYDCPALFVNWSIDHRQTPALATITFRLAYEQTRDTSNLGRNTAEALKFLDFIEITDSILSELESECTGKMETATQELNLEPIVIDEYILVYTCSYNKKAREHVTGKFDDIKIKSGLYKNLFD